MQSERVSGWTISIGPVHHGKKEVVDVMRDLGKFWTVVDLGEVSTILGMR